MSSLKELEKRISELENKVEKLEKNHSNSADKKKSKKEKKSKKNSSSSSSSESEKKSKKKRKPNKFLITMNEARKKKQEKFEYNGAVYKGIPDDKFGMIYRKEK